MFPIAHYQNDQHARARHYNLAWEVECPTDYIDRMPADPFVQPQSVEQSNEPSQQEPSADTETVQKPEAATSQTVQKSEVITSEEMKTGSETVTLTVIQKAPSDIPPHPEPSKSPIPDEEEVKVGDPDFIVPASETVELIRNTVHDEV